MKNAELRARLQAIRDGDWGDVPDAIDTLIADIVDNDEEARLGYATTGQLLDELRARFEVQGVQSGGLDYRPVDPH